MNARVEALFHQLVDLPPEAQDARLSAPDIDDDTRREVESLLANERGATAASCTRRRRRQPDVDNAGGQRPLVCPYRLLKIIGLGGMGAVYLAERADGEVQQRVAVKLLPPGAGLAQRERFLQERQILATVTHPNVARLVDAGHWEHGQPYLAMEYVDGQSIELFTAKLDLAETIRLFVKVCAAVAYLHRQLIVHRDLKPSNILVTADGEPKVLDFGIAKLLDLDAHVTMTRMRVLTPAYASPEQIAGRRLSTASDIYSLGALLYRLITGRSTHADAGDSAEEVVAAVSSRDAVPPSRWTPACSGDLDCILLKALKRDPQERYETVEQFMDDLRAFLDGRPVRARAGGVWYRARKFVAHHRVAVSTSLAGVTLLLAALGYATAQARVARSEARRAQDINAFILSLFQAASPAGGGSHELRAIDLLQQSLPRIEQELADQPERQMELDVSVGRGLLELNAHREGLAAFDKVREIASRSHVPPTNESVLTANIGSASALVAIGDLKRAAEWLDDVEAHLATGGARVQAEALGMRSYLLLNQQRPREAVAPAERAVALLAKANGNESLSTLQAMLELARARYHADRCAEAMPEIDRAMDLVPRVASPTHSVVTLFRGVRARCLKDLNRLDESAAEFERNDAGVRTIFGPLSKDYGVELYERGNMERDRGNSDATVGLLTRAIEIYDTGGVGGFSHVMTERGLMLALLQKRDLASSTAVADRALDFAKIEFGADHTLTLTARFYATLLHGLRTDPASVMPKLEQLAALPNTEVDRPRRQQLLVGRDAGWR